MDELRRVMLDAGAPPDEWQAELPFLIEVGQKRVRRRRMIATGVAAAVITAVGTTAVLAGVPGLNKSDPDPVKELPSGVYVEERISPAEVERRCNIVFDNQGGQEREAWVAGVDEKGRAVPAAKSVRPVENRVGHLVELTKAGATIVNSGNPGGEVEDGTQTEGGMTTSSSPGIASCTIPQESSLESAGTSNSGSLPAADDDQRVAELCSRLGGYDVRGWSLLAAAGLDGVDAVFMSANGFTILCSVTGDGVGLDFVGRVRDEEGEPVLPADDAGRRDSRRYADFELGCFSNKRGPMKCMAVGVFGGLPDRYRVEVTFPDGTTEVSETREGAYAFALERPAGSDQITYTVRVRAPDGAVVWGRRATGGMGSAESYVPPVPPAARP